MLWMIPILLLGIIIYWQSVRQKSNSVERKIIEGDIKRKQNCVNCKFLVKSVETGNGKKDIVVDSTERQKILSMDYSFVSNSSVPWKLGCSQGIWQEKGVGFTEEKLNEVLINRDRKNNCPFENYTG
ncbi:MAG: hypothetical protein ACQERZ_08875 [Fusobacteriota bacterium]